MQKHVGLPFMVELSLDDNVTFFDFFLEAVDKSFLSLGEPVKKLIYLYLEDSGITKSEIPFRINDFQNALEKLFGVGTRHIEILIIKNLHAKIKIKYKNALPSWFVPDITFQEYIRQAKMTYEKSKENPGSKYLHQKKRLLRLDSANLISQ
jgi:hypothetical protein